MEILAIIFGVYAVFSLYMCVKCVQIGVKIASKPEKAAEDRIFHVPAPKKTVKMTEEEKRRNTILSNIDRYDGTSNGQIPVKEK